MLVVKNNTENEQIWCGQTVASSGIYQIQATEQYIWANDDLFLEALVNGSAIINDGYNDITPGYAINLLKQIIIYPGAFFQSDYSDLLYRKVSANSDEFSSGIVIPNNKKVGLYRYRANGADPNAYVFLVWDYGGTNEKIFSSTKGDIDLYFDFNNSNYQITGNGTSKLQIGLINDNDSISPIIGGQIECIGVN